MPSIPVPIHSYALDSRQASNGRLINCFAEQAPLPGKGPVYLRLAPGTRNWSDSGLSPGRGLHVWGNQLVAVAAGQAYLITGYNSANAITPPGVTISNSGRVFIASSAQQLVIVDPGVAGFVWSGSGTFLGQITDPDFTSRSPGAVDFIDNYLVFVDEGSGRFFASDLADATSYDALNFATAEVAPDNLVTLICSQQEIVLLGKTTGERWYNAGSSGFPFQRVPGGTFESGCVGRFARFKMDNTIGWLANDLTLRMLRGPVPVRVSQHGFEQAIRSYPRVDDCECFTYTLDGHVCAVLRFPTANACWVYDATTGEMHERQDANGDIWSVHDAVTLDGVVYVQQKTPRATVGVLTHDTFKEFANTIEDEQPLRYEATFQGIQGEANERLYFNRLELLCEVGQGLVSGQGSDPRIALEISNDGGESWHAMPSRTLGAQGQYRTRVKWDGLGSARHRVFRVSGADPVPFTMWGAYADVERSNG